MYALLSLLFLGSGLHVTIPVDTGAADHPPEAVADTFGDLRVQALIGLAREARGASAEGLESFEGRMWERMYVGFDGATFRRERALFQRETSARIRWTADGERVAHWEAGRMDVPITGWSSAQEDYAEGFAGSLLRGGPPPPLAFEPGSDRLFFGTGNWALDPLADTAGLHYRYESGDTIRVVLPEDGRRITVAEVRVIPRRSEFRLLSASLWFDEATGALVRGLYRPSRPFDVRLDGNDDYPWFLPSIEAEIRVISMDYSLHELQWWIPHRFAFEGEVRAGRFARLPITLEWSVTELLTNEDAASDLVPDSLPEGWQRRTVEMTERGDGPDFEFTTVVPPAGELAAGAGLRGAAPGVLDAISLSELREFEERLARSAPLVGLGLRTEWGLAEGLTRYNRVEGFATGVTARQAVPPGLGLIGGGEFGATVRIGTSAHVPTGEFYFRRGSPDRTFRVGAFRRLVPSGGFDSPHSLSSSTSTLLGGGGPAPFHRALGGEVAWDRGSRTQQGRLRLFVERQSEAEKGTDVHLWRVFSSDREMPGVLEAERGTWGGVQLHHRWQSGLDPARARLFVRSEVEGGAGESEYARGQLVVGTTLPLGSTWAAAFEVAGGRGVGELPLQRYFAPGGPGGYRGGRVGERLAEGFTLVRSEVGRGFAGARAVVFADLLHTFDPPAQAPPPLLAHRSGGELAAGAGFSFLDGLVRMEVARPVSTSGSWRALFYLDGLF